MGQLEIADWVSSSAPVTQRKRPVIFQTDSQHLVGIIAVHLQHAAEAGEMAQGVLGAASWGVEIGDRRWRSAGPGPRKGQQKAETTVVVSS